MEISNKFSQIMKEKVFGKQDIFFIIENFNLGKISKQQMSEFLFYVYDNGFTEKQTFDLTCAMMSDGKKLDLSDFNLSVDKHSTGGVSDSTTLIVVPLFACLGFSCYKMSGGALGHTGGTADKLKQFKNINIQLDTKTALEITKKYGGCFTMQTQDFAPIDKKIYALRDEIGAVQSIPLIASSIMSKKLVSGASNIVLDVKYGSGALIQDKNGAENLAKLMCEIGKLYGKDVCYVLGDMSQPLGRAIGDKFEVLEVLNLLTEYKNCNLINHSIHLVCQFANKIGLSYKTCYEKCEKLIKDGVVFDKLSHIITAQGGTMPKIEKVENIDGFLISSNKSGTITNIQTDKLGALFHKYSSELQGGYMLKVIGDKVDKDEPLIKVFAKQLNESFVKQLFEIYDIK